MPYNNATTVAAPEAPRKTYPAPKERRVRYPVPDEATGSPMLEMLRDAGVRMAPLNRIRPGTGHWIGDCPRCGKEKALWVLPGGTRFETACTCWHGAGGVFALYALLVRP